MLSARLVWKRNGSCSTTPMWRRTSARASSRRSAPSSRTQPSSGSSWREEVRERGLPAAARADDRHDLTGRDLEAHTVEHLAAATEPHANALENDSAPAVPQRDRRGRLDDVG